MYNSVDAAAAASPGRMSELIFSLLLDDWSVSGTSRCFFLQHQSETSIIWSLAICQKLFFSQADSSTFECSVKKHQHHHHEQQQQGSVFLPVLQQSPLVSSKWTAPRLCSSTDLSLSLPWRSCLYMVWVSTSGSSGSLQSPRVTAEWVRLQPVTVRASLTFTDEPTTDTLIVPHVWVQTGPAAVNDW